MGGRERQERRHRAEGGVVDEQPQLAAVDLRAKRLDEIGAGQVQLDRMDRDAMAPGDLRAEGSERRGVAVDQQQVEAARAELPRPLRPETGGRARDQRPAPVTAPEVVAHRDRVGVAGERPATPRDINPSTGRACRRNRRGHRARRHRRRHRGGTRRRHRHRSRDRGPR